MAPQVAGPSAGPRPRSIGLDASECLVVAVDGLCADRFHRAGLVKDDKVVDKGLLCCFHSCSVLMLYIYILSDIPSVLQS